MPYSSLMQAVFTFCFHDYTCRPVLPMQLCMRPTPIHRWRLAGVPEDFNLSIKRDDLTGSTLTGNKVSLRLGCSGIPIMVGNVLYSSPLSNHESLDILLPRQWMASETMHFHSRLPVEHWTNISTSQGYLSCIVELNRQCTNVVYRYVRWSFILQRQRRGGVMWWWLLVVCSPTIVEPLLLPADWLDSRHIFSWLLTWVSNACNVGGVYILYVK